MVQEKTVIASDAADTDDVRKTSSARLPTMNTYVVTRMIPLIGDCGFLLRDSTERITVEAHSLSYDLPNVVSFVDYVIDPGVGFKPEMHRVFFGVLDVEMVARMNVARARLN